MEESKVKTAKDINVLQLDKNQIIDECTGDYLLGEKTGIKEIILNAMDRWLEQESSMIQSHITKLEAQVSDLETALIITKNSRKSHIEKYKSLEARNKELEGENKEMKSTMQYLWQLEFLNSGQYGYAVRANTFKYVDREIAEQALKTFNCPSCGANWDTGKHNSCSCGANISRTSTK